MKIAIDAQRCVGHAECVDLAPDLFQLEESGRAVVLDASPDEPLWQAARLAAMFCPASAIVIEEDRK